MKNTEGKPLGFTFFISYSDAMKALTMENKGRMLTAMTDYVFRGKQPQKGLLDVRDKGQAGIMSAVWSAIRPNLQTSRNRSHPGKSGAPVGNRNASKQMGAEGKTQSKNNQMPPEDKNKDGDKDMDKETIEKSMVVGSHNDDNNLSFSLISNVRNLWASVKDNENGLQEAQWLQNEVSRYRTDNPDLLSEQELIKFMVYWATPIDCGEYAGHCRYIETRGKTNTFCVPSRLASWKSKTQEK